MKLVRVEIIEAVPFEFGMEDGVRRFNYYIPRDAKDFNAPWTPESKKHLGYLERYDNDFEGNKIGFGEYNYKPFIGDYSDPKAEVKKGDYVIIHKSSLLRKGRAEVVCKEILRKEDLDKYIEADELKNITINLIL